MSFNPTIQKMFNLVDTDRDGLLTLEEVVLLFRALGQSPSEKEMTTAIRGLLNWHIIFFKKKIQFSDFPSAISFDQFCVFFEKNYRAPLHANAIEKALKIHDTTETGEK